uniref:Acyltransferase n=1 Tax=Panagrellus redivivus TaxID=6233 RepID=A0A7E4V666_PANRE
MTLLGPPNGTNPRPHQNKRNDIQVLRFVAIAAVLGFHLRPKSVPQGYLGVDMFFVISGYLMTLITASSKGAITTAIIKRFYERRLKRLCPAYVFTLFVAIVIGKVVLIATDFESLRTDSFWALIFGTNIQSMLAQEDYFQLVSEYKFLLHTWSLSVEVQFYAAAPFILAWIARSQRPLITCGFITVQKALNGQYKTLYFAARPGCLAFDGVNQMYAKRFGCAEVVGLTEKILKTLKPDVMVIIQRIDNHVSFTSRRSGNTTTADYLQKTLANYSKYTKKIFVVEPNRVVGYNVPLFLAKTLKNGQPIDNVFITLAKHKQAVDHGWNQMLDAMKTCPRCEPIWIRNQLCHAEKCLLYEKKSKLALYCDNAHLSTIGIDVIMPAFRTALKKAFKEIKGV